MLNTASAAPVSAVDTAGKTRHASIALAAYCVLLFFVNLGAAPLIDVDEGAFSEATREMLERGDFVTTYLNGELRFDKPILTYWLQAVPVALFGAAEWAFRAPSALAACLWAWLLFRFARRYAPAAAHMAVFMLASALGPLLIARTATADALLNAFVAGSLFAFYRHLESGARRELVEAFGWMGLGVLTKGPIALAVPALALAAYCASRREWLRPFSLLREPRAWAVFLLIVVPWYALELHAQGQRFVDSFFLKHNVNRFTGTMLGHGGHVWYYLVALPLLVFPFLAPLAGAVRSVRRATRDDMQRFMWCAFAAVFLFFSFSRTQLPHYLLYGATPLFLLLAIHRDRFAGAAVQAAPAALGLLVIAVLPWIAQAVEARTTNAFTRAVLSDFGPALRPVSVVAAIALVALVVLTLWSRRLPDRDRTDARLVLAGALPALVMVLALWPRGITWYQAPIAAAGEAMRSTPGIVQWNSNWPSFSVYRRAATPARRPVAGEIVLTRFDRAGELPPHEVIFTRREVLLARIRGTP